jgi:hypothetical protein
MASSSIGALVAAGSLQPILKELDLKSMTNNLMKPVAGVVELFLYLRLLRVS